MRLHVHEWGDRGARPLVALHGVGGHGRRFRTLAEEALASRFRVLAPDLRGHGRSGWEPPWSVEAQVADVLETVDEAEVERAVWLGHSFGARLVMEIAARDPARVERTVLLDPAIQLPPGIGLAMADQERRKRESHASVEEAIEWRLSTGRLLRTPRAFLEEEMADHLVPDGTGRFRYRYSPSAVVAAYGEMCRPHPGFDRVRVPTLLVLASEQSATWREQVEEYAAALGDLLTVHTVGGGHVVLWDAYEETRDAIVRFVGGAGP